MRGRSEFQDLKSPAESVGNTGAAVVPIMLGMALAATEKGYAPGSPVLIEASGDNGAVARPSSMRCGDDGLCQRSGNLRQEAGQQDHRGKLPDTCMTPPENPATPPGVPVPYPSFGTDGDLTNGTSTVKIGGETVSKKNLSYYSKTTGTEAGCAGRKVS